MSFSNTQEQGRPLAIKDEGVTLTSNAASLDFTGAGVSGTNVGNAVTEDISGGGGAGSGDVSSNTALSVDSEVALFSGTGGKTIKRATTTGIAKLTSGVLSAATDGTDYLSSTTGVKLDQTSGQTIGATGARLTKLWAVDITVTNAIAGSITGTAAIATTVTAANEATDTTCFPTFVTAATGDLGVKTNAGLTFNSATGVLAATGFSGPLTGNVTGNVSGSSGSTTGNAATATALQTARTIGGVSFDGSANITVASATGGFAVSGGALTVGAGTVSAPAISFTADADNGMYYLGTNNYAFTVGGSKVLDLATTGLTITGSVSATNLSGTNTGDQTSVSGNAGTATALATPRAIYGNNFDGTAALTQVIASTYGGTGNGFTKFTGPTTAERTFTLPDASSTIVVQGGALGTPSSGTLTNCSSLPISGLTASTSTALGVGSIELGHASDTTLARVSAGVVSIEGVNIVTTSSTDTLTNKTLTAPKIADLGYLADANGNELIIFDTVASAVNEVTFANAATGSDPNFTASGGDTNIGLKFTAKGTGKISTVGSVNHGDYNVYFTETDNGNSSTADTIDWTKSNHQKSTLTGNCTFTFTAPNGPCMLSLKLVQDGTGSRTVTWPAAVHWAGGTAPTLTTTASKVDVITFYYDGSTYFGAYSLNYTA